MEIPAMTKRTAKLMLGSLCFGSAVTVAALGISRATPPVGVVSTNISGPVSFGEIEVIDNTPGHHVRIRTEGMSDVYVREVTIAPEGQTGWHAHPGPGFVSVKSGVGTYYSGEDDDCTPVVHPAGTGFMEPAGPVHILRNEGTEPLDVVVLFILPPGAAPRIDMPNPGNCPF
jgi:quercetin dioxygenase-like cupin family protein